MIAPNMAAAAVDYCFRFGWPIFPVHTVTAGRCSCGTPHCDNPGKHPRVAHGFKAASIDESQIRAWWRWWPESNIAIATGRASGLFVVDVDPDHGGDDSLSELERQHRALPLTVRQFTGGGGEHRLFRYVPGLRSNAGRLGPGLDIRADDGYIIAPPSLHVSGRRYAWDVDSHPLHAAIADAPPWLIALVQESGGLQAEPKTASPEKWINALSLPCTEGKRNNTLARLTGYLLRRYVDPFAVLELVRLWNLARCQPPLNDAELLRTVDSICAKEVRRREAAHG